MKSYWRTFWMLGLFLLPQGCSQCYECLDGHMTHMYDRRDARRSWAENRECYVDQEYQRDFRDGFLNGYYDVMQGGGQCLPTLPPRKYWSVHNRGPDAHCRITAWFNGYSQGSLQAMADGVQNRGQILTAAQIYAKACPTCPPMAINLPADVVDQALQPSPLDGLPALVPGGPALVPPAEPMPLPENYMPQPVVEPPALPGAAQQDLKEELFGQPDKIERAADRPEFPVSSQEELPATPAVIPAVSQPEPIAAWLEPVPVKVAAEPGPREMPLAVVQPSAIPREIPLTEVVPIIIPRQPAAGHVVAQEREIPPLKDLVQQAELESRPGPAFLAPVQMVEVQDAPATARPDVRAVITLPAAEAPGKVALPAAALPGKISLPPSAPNAGRISLPASR